MKVKHSSSMKVGERSSIASSLTALASLHLLPIFHSPNGNELRKRNRLRNFVHGDVTNRNGVMGTSIVPIPAFGEV
jgi:hypothetical protein